MKKTVISFLFFALLGMSAAFAAEPEAGFISLFNGKDLSGWVKHGGAATYKVEDGMIVGTCTPRDKEKPLTQINTFLCSEKTYGNFILKLQFKVLSKSGNSGVQFRSAYRVDKVKGTELERVFGYQCEIDPSAKNDTARIYDEGRRGFKYKIIWLDDTSDEVLTKARAAYNRDGWNDLEIQAVGPSLRTWINGVPCVNIFDYLDFSGFIGLQVHAGQEGTIAWRNIRIKDLGVSKWEPFFVKENGKTVLKNAYYILPKEWSFDEKGGFLRGVHGKTEKRDGLVISEKNYDDFVAKVSYRIYGGNSGLYFRAEENDVPWTMRGFQNEISDDKSEKSKYSVSGIWHTQGKAKDGSVLKGRGWLAKNEEFVAKLLNKDDWNTIVTVAYKNRLINFLNGFKTIDFTDDVYNQKSGKLGLQLHGGNDSEMWFKDFEVMPITPEMRKLIDR